MFCKPININKVQQRLLMIARIFQVYDYAKAEFDFNCACENVEIFFAALFTASNNIENYSLIRNLRNVRKH